MRNEDNKNLLLVATDDCYIRAYAFNNNQFVPLTTTVSEEKEDSADGKIKNLISELPQFCLAWDDVH